MILAQVEEGRAGEAQTIKAGLLKANRADLHHTAGEPSVDHFREGAMERGGLWGSEERGPSWPPIAGLNGPEEPCSSLRLNEGSVEDACGAALPIRPRYTVELKLLSGLPPAMSCEERERPARGV